MGARRKNDPKRKKIGRIVAACFVVLCLLVELLGYVPGLTFRGWVDVFSWIGLAQPYVISPGELQVHFIDVGNADCILVRQDGYNMLIDTGETPQEPFVLDYLDRHKIDRLDLVISTHPHVDHMGMMAEIVQHVPVEKFILSYMPEGKEPTNQAYTALMETLENRSVAVEEARPGSVYALGEACVQIVAPYAADEPIEDPNQISVVARLTFGKHAFLFTGDAEIDLEERMVASGYDLSADVLKVAHHGSRTSSSPAFLRAVSPRYAVISCGRNNDYGHPHDEVIARLVEMDAQIYRTDAHGDIVFVSDGSQLSVRTEKGEERSFWTRISVRWIENVVQRTAVNTAVLFLRAFII